MGWVRDAPAQTILSFSALYKSNPIWLQDSILNINFLKDCQWIGISSIDVWLMYIYETAHQPEVKYIPSSHVS